MDEDSHGATASSRHGFPARGKRAAPRGACSRCGIIFFIWNVCTPGSPTRMATVKFLSMWKVEVSSRPGGSWLRKRIGSHLATRCQLRHTAAGAQDPAAWREPPRMARVPWSRSRKRRGTKGSTGRLGSVIHPGAGAWLQDLSLRWSDVLPGRQGANARASTILPLYESSTKKVE
eukprot:scaffold2254_cov393-Prasinococcus_capsulatus_cf.AAC.15